MEIIDVISEKKRLFGTALTVRASMFVAGDRCWLAPAPQSAKDIYSRAIMVKCPGLDSELFCTTGTNPRVGGPCSPACFDDVYVTGILTRSPFREFEAMLTDISSVIVIGYQGREISVRGFLSNGPHV